MGHHIPLIKTLLQTSTDVITVFAELTYWSPAHWGPEEINGLLVSPGKAYMLRTDHLITCEPLSS